MLVFLLISLFLAGDHRCWDVDPVRPVGDLHSCKGFCAVPGPLQSVQRAELWGVILALQSSGAVHLGVDNFKCRSSCWAVAGWSAWSYSF